MTEFLAFTEAPHISAPVIPATYPALIENCFAFISRTEPPQPGIHPWNFFPPSCYEVYLYVYRFTYFCHSFVVHTPYNSPNQSIQLNDF